MTEALVAMVLGVLSVFGAGPSRNPEAPRVAEAIAQAVAAEPAPASGESHALDAALLALYAVRESGVSEHPMPFSWDARAGVSCGVWQEPCAVVRRSSLVEQAAWWLASLRARGLASLDSSPTRARQRTAHARRVLAQVLIP